ncbi:MAG TPA: hypothetical protein VM935_16950 [Chitinophagaceae bacterium]|jgi:hypothetical protein|nr:hypothetical protein [Chitinophagaceae bacterium]
MFHYKVSYNLIDSKTAEEFVIFLYCKSPNEKFNRSDLPGAVKDAIYSIGHIEEVKLNVVETITEEEYNKNTV